MDEMKTDREPQEAVFVFKQSFASAEVEKESA
jgi:hypothetical protein